MSRAGQKPVFVVLEGLDGAGKTTCAKALAALIGARYMTTPSLEVRKMRQKLMTGSGTSQETAQLFYLWSVFDASDKVSRALQAGTSVVLDRYFLSTQVYAQFRGTTLDLDGTATSLVQPDLTVYLDAPLAIRRKRLHQRGATDADRETLSPQADQLLRELYRQKSSLPVAGRWREFPALSSPAAIAHDIARVLAGFQPSATTIYGRQP